MNNTVLQDFAFTSKVTRQKHKKTTPYWSFIWYLAGLPLIIAASTLITWHSFYYRTDATVMILLCASVYVAAFIYRQRTTYFRSYRNVGLSAFYITIGFIIAISVLAGFRLYYSRTFLLASYLLCLGWYCAGMLLFKNSPLCLLVIKGGLANALNTFANEHWHFAERVKQQMNLQNYDRIVIDLNAHSNSNLVAKLAASSLNSIPIIFAVSVYEQFSGRIPIDHIKNEVIFRPSFERTYDYVKRLLDLFCVFILFVFSSPVMLISAVIIKMGSDGPVIFKQERIGKNGQLFTLYKFRSMSHDAENEGAKFAREDDLRITGFGKFIRKFRIDELPQFWNILKGDMSLIGPRPEQPSFAELFDEEIPFYAYRYKVRPGITGWAQINDGYVYNVEGTKRKLEYDLYYIKNMSLSLDLLIIYATMRTVLSGSGSR